MTVKAVIMLDSGAGRLPQAAHLSLGEVLVVVQLMMHLRAKFSHLNLENSSHVPLLTVDLWVNGCLS